VFVNQHLVAVFCFYILSDNITLIYYIHVDYFMTTLTSYLQIIQKQDNFIRQNSPINIEECILGSQESLTKLWVASKNNKDIELRIANVFYGAFVLASQLGIKDLDSVLNDRMQELEVK